MARQIKKISAGDHSVSIQSENIIIRNGVTYSEARVIALDVYKANFIKLSEEAAQVALNRAKELIDTFLAKLKEKTPNAISTMKDPRMQVALFTAQKEYARIGNKDLEELLVDLLIERANQKQHCEEQIVLDESLNVVSKLTLEHLNALTVILLLLRSKQLDISNCEEFEEFVDNKLLPFVADLSSQNSRYEHLEYAGCGSIMRVARWSSIEKIFHFRFPALFSNNPFPEVRKYLLDIRPTLQNLFDVWEHSLISRFNLTTVGVAIAQANCKRKTGERLQTGDPIISPYVIMGT